MLNENYFLLFDLKNFGRGIFPAINAAIIIHGIVLNGKHNSNSIVTVRGFLIAVARIVAVIIAMVRLGVVCSKSAMPYPIETPEKITGKKCPPRQPE